MKFLQRSKYDIVTSLSSLILLLAQHPRMDCTDEHLRDLNEVRREIVQFNPVNHHSIICIRPERTPTLRAPSIRFPVMSFDMSSDEVDSMM